MSLEYYPSMWPKEERPSGKGRFLVMDAEGIGLLKALRRGDPSSLHCILAKDDRTQEVFIFFDPFDKRDPANREEVEMEGEQDGYLWDGIKFLMEAEAVISQNFSGYDGLAFEKVFGKKWQFNYMQARGKDALHGDVYPNRLMDTYVMSCVLNPERKVPGNAYAIGRGNVGPHSIEAHGIRIGRHKPENEDWSKLTDHMLHRCEEDVHIGQDLFHYLRKEWVEQSERPNPRTGLSVGTAYRCELQVALAMARQAQRGFRVHTARALERVAELDTKIDETEREFRPHMPMRIVKKKLDVPVNGYTHGSKYVTQDAITKKLSAKDWCALSQSDKFALELSDDAVLMLGDGGKITQKDWLSVCPVQQLNGYGEYTPAVTKHYPECRGFIHDHKDPLVVGPFTPIEWEDIPLGNRDSVKQVLYEHGWLGVNYNETEQEKIDNGKEDELDPWAGKIDEDSLEAWKKRQGEIPSWCEGIAAWYILNSRRNQILNKKDVDYFEATKKEEGVGRWPRQQSGKHECRGILAKAWNDDYGISASEYYQKYGEWPTSQDEEWRAPAEAFFCATNTFRMRHKIVVNIPSRGLYPLRDLFIAGKGKKILGCDGSGLELRMLAHFMADAIYQEVVLNGDIHTYNQLKAGLPERDMAKTFIYAFLYGSGIRNLASVCGVTEEEMAVIVENFKRELPALSALIEKIQVQGEYYGYLLAVDGRWGRIRSRDGKLLVHTMLNVLLQMTGSLSMKYGLCFAERKMVEEGVGLDEFGHPAWVANVHKSLCTLTAMSG